MNGDLLARVASRPPALVRSAAFPSARSAAMRRIRRLATRRSSLALVDVLTRARRRLAADATSEPEPTAEPTHGPALSSRRVDAAKKFVRAERTAPRLRIGPNPPVTSARSIRGPTFRVSFPSRTPLRIAALPRRAPTLLARAATAAPPARRMRAVAADGVPLPSPQLDGYDPTSLRSGAEPRGTAASEAPSSRDATSRGLAVAAPRFSPAVASLSRTTQARSLRAALGGTSPRPLSPDPQRAASPPRPLPVPAEARRRVPAARPDPGTPFLSVAERSPGPAPSSERPARNPAATPGHTLSGDGVAKDGARADRTSSSDLDRRAIQRLVETTLRKALDAAPTGGRSPDLRAVPMAVGRPIPTP